MQITVEALEHRYRPESDPVMRSLSHTFEPGTLTGVTGPSGSGKSTLMYLLALMLTPSHGIIRWNDKNLQDLRDAERARLRARHVGFVFQDAVLDLSRTGLENVLEAAWLAGMSREQAEPIALELMDQFGVGARASHRPGEVSGGQAQRIALCRALVKSPQILFADEPTGNLDSDSARIVWDALADAARAGATVIVATHDEVRAAAMPNHLRLAA